MASSLSPARPEPPPRLSLTQWLILFIAVVGFAFDTYELLMLPLVIRPAISELAGATPGTQAYARWAAALFYAPAVAGGIFGLLGGYLTDRLGRRRVLTGSILLYAVSAFASGFSTSMPMLLVLRCLTFIGVCVEFVAATAWLAELFPEPRERERVLGHTQVFSSFGGFMVAGANWLILHYLTTRLPAVQMPAFAVSWLGTVGAGHEHEAWRYTLMSGLVPAIPLLLIRPFLPESPIWQAKRRAGTLQRPRFGELFAPALRRTTIVATIMMACGFGAAFGAIQQIQQIVSGLPQVRAHIAEQDLAPRQARAYEQSVAAGVTLVQEIGGLAGRFLLALLAVRIMSRRALIRVFQVPGLLVMPVVFGVIAVQSLPLLYGGMFLAGLLTVGQFSFWGNYLPVVYPLHLRGTGESFAANIGGRMIGTSFALVTQLIAAQAFIPGGRAPTKLAYTAAGVGLFVYLVGFLMSFWLPEPRMETLPD